MPVRPPHRRHRAFSAADVEIVLDIARLAQPTLNMLRCLEQVQQALDRSREALETLRAANAREFRLGAYQTFDPWFAREVLEPLKRVSRADRVNILVLGPTGAGKTHLAEAYHYECPRAAGPFVVLDCAQVTSVETLSAELFGYAPDSGYANAPRGGRPGKAQLAHRGTLFIDEIGCLPAELQQKLLRLIERGEFSPLGSGEVRRVDLQILSATNEDLAGLVRLGRFREDLFWRISDIPHLARGFLRRACERIARTGLEDLDETALHRLLKHDWARAGNVRGLERTIFRSVLLAPPGIRRLEALHLQLQQIDATAPAPRATREARGALHGAYPGDARARSGGETARSGAPEARSGDARDWSGNAGGQSGEAGDQSGDSRTRSGDAGARSGHARGWSDDAARAEGTGDRPGDARPPAGVAGHGEGTGSRALPARDGHAPRDPATSSVRRRPGSPRLEEVKAAIQEYGYASAAARALGISYRELTWQLHKVGLTVRDVLAERD
jgi:transcriptional regulator with GAF, ATPase, and Fis domain